MTCLTRKLIYKQNNVSFPYLVKYLCYWRCLMGGAFALNLAAPCGDNCSAHGSAFTTFLKHTVRYPETRGNGRVGWQADYGLEKNWEFEVTFPKKKQKSENHKKVSGHLCNIPKTTRSGIEVGHFSPVAISLSQTINLVHSIFFWVDIHCYVCQKECISLHLNITKICKENAKSKWFLAVVSVFLSYFY